MRHRPVRVGPRGHGDRRLGRQLPVRDVGTIGAPAVAKNDFDERRLLERAPAHGVDRLAGQLLVPRADRRRPLRAPPWPRPARSSCRPRAARSTTTTTSRARRCRRPCLTGPSTLVRQYFYDGYGPAGGQGFAGGAPPAERHNPERRAGARPPSSTAPPACAAGTRATTAAVRDLDGQWPSAGQGFGLVNLDNSLYFADDPMNDWYHDVYRRRRRGLPGGTAGTRSYQMKVGRGCTARRDPGLDRRADLLPAGTPRPRQQPEPDGRRARRRDVRRQQHEQPANRAVASRGGRGRAAPPTR